MTDSSLPKPATALTGFSLARKMIIAALVLHFFSLFFAYVDANSDGVQVKVYLEKWHVEPVRGGNPEQTGFQILPYAKYVVIGLLILFASDFNEEKLWRRFGYWIAFGLLLKFAYGGAPFRTLGGKMASVSMLVVLIAAYINYKDLKRQKRSPVLVPSDKPD